MRYLWRWEYHAYVEAIVVYNDRLAWRVEQLATCDEIIELLQGMRGIDGGHVYGTYST